VIDCLMPNEELFSYIMTLDVKHQSINQREQVTFDVIMMMSGLYYTSALSCIFIVLAH